MYMLVKVIDKVKISPKYMQEDKEKALLESVKQDFEGVIDANIGIIIAVTDVKKISEGYIVPGDPNIYYEAEIELLVMKPYLHELVETKVVDVREFGSFVMLGPIEGLIHISQITDEYMYYDAKNNCFVSKEKKKRLSVNDVVLAKIISISLKSTVADSKIGLTTRQEFLGKLDWIEKEIKEREKAKKKESKEKEAKKQKAK